MKTFVGISAGFMLGLGAFHVLFAAFSLDSEKRRTGYIAGVALTYVGSKWASAIEEDPSEK